MASSDRPLAHPLCGADPATLAAVLWRNGGVAPRSWHQLAVMLGAVAGRFPFTLAERAVVRRRRRRMPPAPPPIFLLGHWRSGTTHLYNILSKSPDLGFVPPVATGMPWDMLVLARLLRPLLDRMLPDQRYIDRIPVHPDSPQEDEAAMANMQPVSFFHGLYFPRRLRRNVEQGVFFDHCAPRDIHLWKQRFACFLDKLSIQQPGRQIVIKNPVYTARVAMLAEMYPQAKFVHIHRDPLVVFQSMQNFYAKLLEVYSLQEADRSVVDELILTTYPRMMDALLEDAAALPADRYIEIRYDELDDTPMLVLERIYEQLGLSGFGKARPHFEAYLGSVSGYRKNKHPLDAGAAQQVATRWRRYFDHWHYDLPPQSISPPQASSLKPAHDTH